MDGQQSGKRRGLYVHHSTREEDAIICPILGGSYTMLF